MLVALITLVVVVCFYVIVRLTMILKQHEPGMDVNFAKKQEWWSQVENIVQADEKTYRRLVENLYVNVVAAKLGELEFATKRLMESKDVEGTLQALAKRQAQIEHFAKLENLKEVKTDEHNV